MYCYKCRSYDDKPKIYPCHTCHQPFLMCSNCGCDWNFDWNSNCKECYERRRFKLRSKVGFKTKSRLPTKANFSPYIVFSDNPNYYLNG